MCLKLRSKEKTMDKAQSVSEINIRIPQKEVLSVVGVSDKAEKYKNGSS
jgi:ABC-type phosphate/phosphonate transport system ATPase subunit